MKMGLLLLMSTVLSGCGSLTLSPRSCKTQASYGESNEVYDDYIERDYFAYFVDREVKLKDLIDCEKITKAKVAVTKKFFFKYRIRVDFKDE
jgi:hypothetical protein